MHVRKPPMRVAHSKYLYVVCPLVHDLVHEHVFRIAVGGHSEIGAQALCVVPTRVGAVVRRRPGVVAALVLAVQAMEGARVIIVFRVVHSRDEHDPIEHVGDHPALVEHADIVAPGTGGVPVVELPAVPD